MEPTTPSDDSLPEPGPPFRKGDEVAFFPAEIESPEDPGWLRLHYAVIEDVNQAAQSVGFHFVATPNARQAQGMENVVRRTPAYAAWRSAFEAALATTNDPGDAHARTRELWVRVLAEHPIHGGSTFPHPAVASRRVSGPG